MSKSKSKPQNNVMVKIPTVEILKLHVFALIWGMWTLFRQLIKRVWKTNSESSKSRGNPPSCLTDATLGKHSYIKVQGVKLHYVEAGEKYYPLLILLHGFPDCWITWRYQIPVLAKHYRVIALDLKGYGDSDKPQSRRSYRLKRIVSELRELIRLLGCDTCTLVGHDLGALIGWFFVYNYPEMVDKFIALAASHPNLYWSTLPSASLFNLRWIQLCQIPEITERQLLEDDLKIFNTCYRHLATNNTSQFYLDAYKYSFSRKEDWTGAINYFRSLPFWRINPEAPSVSVPTLLAVGNKDSSVHLESVVKSTEALDKFALKLVTGASHYIHQERPLEVNKLLLNFLIGEPSPTTENNNTSNGFVTRMFGAVSSTVKYGNSVFDVVQKRTNGLTARALSLGGSST